MYNNDFWTIFENSDPSEQEIKSTKELEHANPALSFMVNRERENIGVIPPWSNQ